MGRFEGKNVVVTGGSNGIGYATAVRLVTGAEYVVDGGTTQP